MKARGTQLGNRTNLAEAAAKGEAANQAAADTFAANVLLLVRQMQASGITTLDELATALNARGIPTARDGTWHAMTVRNLLQRGAGR
jgi:hypothetical protein